MNLSFINHHLSFPKSLRFSLLLLMALTAIPHSGAAIPEGYYNDIDGLREAQLKTALHQLLYNHTLISDYYDLPDYFRKTDVYPQADPRYGQWWDMYGNIPLYSNSFKGLNREHSFPKSWWGGSTDTPAYTDLNHLYPAEAAANMAKSNYPLGEVSGTPTFDNGITQVGTPVSGQGGGARQVFEPDDEYKGDFARTYFYMVTCYQNLTWKYTWMVSNNTYPTLNTWAVNLLLQWHRADPVSQKELNRNEEVYKVQANRNPFIDFPELAEYLWGELKGEAFHPSEGVTGDPVLITPVQDMALDFGQTVTEYPKVTALQVRGQNIRSNPEFVITGADRAMFSLEQSSLQASDVNKPSGTWLRVTYNPTAIGQHTARLVVTSYDGAKSRGIELRGEALEMPLFGDITATAATSITSESYTANWLEPVGTVDYYTVTRTVYPVDIETYQEELQAETNSLEITGCTPSGRESYNVRSNRLGFSSEPSNEVYVNLLAGIDTATDDGRGIPVGWRVTAEGVTLTVPNGAVVRNVAVLDLQGRCILRLPSVTDGTLLPLSPGVYIIALPGNAEPLRIRF